MTRPRLRRVKESPTSRAWAGEWVMKKTAWPFCRASWIFLRTMPDCRTPSAEVDGAGGGRGLAFPAGEGSNRLVDVADVDAHSGELGLADLPGAFDLEQLD